LTALQIAGGIVLFLFAMSMIFGESKPAGSWIRNPHKSKHAPYTNDESALIYVKVGHLA
jgi:small neutral amino acid transporter SnatA (MarC family)